MNGFCIALAAGMLAAPDTSARNDAEKIEPYAARVTGNSVYVRSGPSTVYYHVATLKMNETVRVVDHKFGFARITPPSGTFSLVSRDYVETLGNGKGTINGDTWAHAQGVHGEAYAKHAELKKGTRVHIDGETEDHYRIVTPAHAALYISRDFIEPVSADAAPPAASQKAPRQPASSKTRSKPAAPRPPKKASSDAPRQPEPQPAGSAEQDLEVVTDAAKRPRDLSEIEELQVLEQQVLDITEQEPMNRDYVEIINAFQELAESHDDPRVRQYAQFRGEQMRKVMTRAAALRGIRDLEARVKIDRLEFSEQRQHIQPTPPPVSRGYAVVGKMLMSFAYTSPVGPRRYRIVDADQPGQRTIAYIEIESDSTIDPQEFIGRHVGVRARSKRLIEGAVDPIEVYTVAEIVILERLPALEVSSSRP